MWDRWQLQKIIRTDWKESTEYNMYNDVVKSSQLFYVHWSFIWLCYDESSISSQTEDNSLLSREIYDFDVVQRAFAMMQVGGILVCIIGLHYKKDKTYQGWLTKRKKEKIIDLQWKSKEVLNNLEISK